MNPTTTAVGCADRREAHPSTPATSPDAHRASAHPTSATSAETGILSHRPTAAALRGAVENRDTHITVTIHLSRNSTLYGIRSMLDSLAFFLRAKMCCYRDESGHLHFDLTPTAANLEAAP